GDHSVSSTDRPGRADPASAWASSADESSGELLGGADDVLGLVAFTAQDHAGSRVRSCDGDAVELERLCEQAPLGVHEAQHWMYGDLRKIRSERPSHRVDLFRHRHHQPGAIASTDK